MTTNALNYIQHLNYTYIQPPLSVVICPVCGSDFALPANGHYSDHARTMMFQHIVPPQHHSQHYSHTLQERALPSTSQPQQMPFDRRDYHVPYRHTSERSGHDEPARRPSYRPIEEVHPQPSPHPGHRQRLRPQPPRQPRGSSFTPPADANPRISASRADTKPNFLRIGAKSGSDEQNTQHVVCNTPSNPVPSSTIVKDQEVELPALLDFGIEKSKQQTRFVLWVGNVPGNATISELGDFFSVFRRQGEGK